MTPFCGDRMTVSIFIDSILAARSVFGYNIKLIKKPGGRARISMKEKKRKRKTS